MSNEAVITTILTIIFGVPSLVALYQSFPSRIIFVIDEQIDIYKEVSQTFKDLEITYKNEKIEKGYYLLKGYFFYRGRMDIEKQQVKTSTYIEIPYDSLWLDCKVISASKDLLVEPIIEEEKLLFNFDLLKNGEYYYFQAFAKIKTQEKISKLFSPNHRIANVRRNILEISHKLASTYKIEAIAYSVISILTLMFVFYMINNDMNDLSIYDDKVQIITSYRGKEFTYNSESKLFRLLRGRTNYNVYSRLFEEHISRNFNLSGYIFGTESDSIKVDKDTSVKFTVSPESNIGFYLLIICIIFGITISLRYGINSYKYGEIINRISDIKRTNNI